MTNQEIKEMIKTPAGFNLFCNTHKHLLEGKPVQLVYIHADEDWLNGDEDLRKWEGEEENYYGVQEVEWNADKNMWVHYGEDTEYTTEDYENWKDMIREYTQDIIAVIPSEDEDECDVADFVMTNELFNANVSIDVNVIETDNYTLSDAPGIKPAIHYKGRVTCYTTNGEEVGYLSIDMATKELVSGQAL